MLKFIFILIVLFFFWYGNGKKKKSFLCSSSILIGIYVISAIFAIPTLSIGEYSEPYHSSYSMGMTQIGEWRSWFFGTIVTSLMRNFGHTGFWVIAVMSLVLFYGIMRVKSGRLQFHQLIYYILYFQIMSQGVFYFKQYTRGGNLFILLTLLLVFFYWASFNPDSAIRINRKS